MAALESAGLTFFGALYPTHEVGTVMDGVPGVVGGATGIRVGKG